MRKEKEVKERLGALCVDRLKKRKEEFLSITSRNCQFNARSRVPGKGMLGFCRNKDLCGSRKSILVCDGDETAKKCNRFKCRNTRGSVEDGFNDILKSPARCGGEYPKIAVLIWFLQDFPTQSRMKRMSRSLRELTLAVRRLLFFRWW